MNTLKRFSSDPTKFVGRFSSILSSFKAGIPHSAANTHFIWAIAVLLVVIFAALYIDIKSNNETILRTNLIKSTSVVAENIELRMTNASSGISAVIAQLEQKGKSPQVFDRYTNEYLNSNSDADLIRLIEPSGRGIETVVRQEPAKPDLRQFDYLNYPAAVRDALRDAFRSNRITISSYFQLAGDPSSYVVVIYPFKMDNTEYGFLVKISLNKLLASSIPSYLKSEFDFSLMHGFDQIAGNSPYNPVDDFTIPSYLRSAEPLPPSIQLYGCNILDTPIILASPLLFWLGILLLFLLTLLFFLNKKIRQNQKELETALEEINLRRAIEISLKIGILITDSTSKILYVNQMICNLTGYSEEDLLGKTVPYPFWAENTPLPSEVLSAGRLTEEDFPYQFDFDIIRKDGESLKGVLLASPFYSTKFVSLGWIYLIRDNTFDFKAQTLINDVISSYQKLLDSVQSAISVVTHKPSGNILGIRNATYKRELGATVHGHEVISRAFKEPFDPEGMRNGEVWVEKLGKWFSVTESRVTLPGGSHVTLQLALDITDKKEAEKTVAEQSTKLENSSRLVTLGEMASTITHEINQPLTAILAYANTAIEVMGSAPQINKNQALEIYRKIATQASRIDKIIKNIRSFAKRRTTMLEVTPLNTIFTDVSELGMLIEKKYPGIKVVCDKPRKMPEVMCDPVQIVQILMNLIRNAAEAITESGAKDKTVTVKAEQLGEIVKFSVADHGPGISDTIKASLFTPFFSTKTTGLGLGLSTCKTIAESHNTRLCINDNKDGGTIFSFELKVANSP